MRILIIEDELLVADHLRRILIKRGYEVIGIADDYASAMTKIELKPDICMLDIRLANNSNGIDIGKKLKELGIDFIYLTANNEVETIRKAAVTKPGAYLTKPFNENDITASIELINARQTNLETIALHTTKGIVELPMSNILYCQADNVYSIIVTPEKTYTERITLKELEGLLNEDFEKVHRSYIVNKNYIDSKSSSKIYIGEFEIPVSRSYRK
ncbi:MAG: DNA-binding response regulator [Crocinitomicaceae bacterium]|nr:DNA-binding response regulator [Crocinitomicaceae bacterium]